MTDLTAVRPQDRWLAWFLAIGIWRSMLLLTAGAILLSEGITAPLMMFAFPSEEGLRQALLVAAIVPGIVAPLVIWLVLYMLHRLHQLQLALAAAATIDVLTGIPNRRFFMAHAEKEYAIAKRYRQPLSLIILDVDNFKAVNDTYGHTVGDVVLCAIATICTSSLRKSDVFARFGGEEFVAVLTATELDAAIQVAEKLRSKVAALRFDHGNDASGVTVSLGVACISDDSKSLLDIIDQADRRLYEAKAAGRNRVVAAASVEAHAA